MIVTAIVCLSPLSCRRYFQDSLSKLVTMSVRKTKQLLRTGYTKWRNTCVLYKILIYIYHREVHSVNELFSYGECEKLGTTVFRNISYRIKHAC